MKILIDECLDWRLCRALSDHQCSSVRVAGWAGLTNGKLLERPQQHFDVFITGDRNLSFQQNVRGFDIAVIVLDAGSTRLADTVRMIPQVLATLQTIAPGQVITIRARG